MDTSVFAPGRSGLLSHPLFSGACKMLNFVSDSELVVTFASCSSALRYEPDVYLNTAYAWLHPLASYSLLDIENCRRMVRNFHIYVKVSLFLLVYLCYSLGN